MMAEVLKIRKVTNETTEKCWVGTCMEDIYHGHGPWGFDIPPVSASKYHAVLYNLPVALKNPPKPRVHNDYVFMPFSTMKFSVVDENGEKSIKQRWEVIQESLLQPINSSKELETAIRYYNKRLQPFLALHHFFDNILEKDEAQEVFGALLPGIIKLALRLPEILPGSLPFLRKGVCRSISLSQLQIASLLANAFLCTFPGRKDASGLYPGANFARLFAAHLRPKREQAVAEKLKCIFHYFRRVLAAEPVGVVTFERKHLPKSRLPCWDRCDNNLGNTRIHVSSSGLIENDGDGLLQVDFANKNVGGGVLAFGCVQEEIRFIICPELIISRLFTEQLAPTEALVVTGAERYSNYAGYGDTFLWTGDYQDKTPHDRSGRRRTSIVAIDATRFTKPVEQYGSSCVLRELNKAYVGFHSEFEGELPAVATGNWGCGAFRGNPHLKSLIQLMACNVAKRDMVYFIFGDTTLRDDVHEMYLFLAKNQITVAQLWNYLCQFGETKLKPGHLYSYIQQALNSKSQPCKKSNKSSSPVAHDSQVKIAPDGTGEVCDGASNANGWDADLMTDLLPIQSLDIESASDVTSSQTEQKVREALPKEHNSFNFQN